MDEPERRRVLRFHRETPQRRSEDKEFRLAVDRELGTLGQLELAAETLGDDARQQALGEIQEVNREFEDLIFNSPAFAHYLDSYLYFKIRFAAGRFRNPRLQLTEPPPLANASRMNERPVGLPSPPEFEGMGSRRVAHDVNRFFALPKSAEAEEALAFLDDYVEESGETREFDLWLRGLFPGGKKDQRFQTLAQGLYDWARERYEFYLSIEERGTRAAHVARWREQTRVEGGFHARNPLAARCGVTELYWLARILRAEVSPRGIVTYFDRSWLHYLPTRCLLNRPKESTLPVKEEILHIEDVLRSVFDYACDMIQNAIEMAEFCQKKRAYPEDYRERPSKSDDWRAVQDAEIEEIGKQRHERLIAADTHPAVASQPPAPRTSETYWSKRTRTGEYQENLVGVALSGGGIRSATFALGVLQRLKDLDFLRQVDYLSTVSGGGYIGSWLLGNVRRTQYFLSAMTSWEESIDYLRNYSKYLAPQSGFLSADTWVIWGTWIRNATLIQLTAIAWLSALFALAFLAKAGFEAVGRVAGPMRFALTAILVFLAWRIWLNLRTLRERKVKPTEHRTLVLLAWAGAFVAAALLWSTSVRLPHDTPASYRQILLAEWTYWHWYLGVCLFGGLYALALISLRAEDHRGGGLGGAARILWSFVVVVLSGGVLYLAICGVRYLFDEWAAKDSGQLGWYAYVFGPELVLLSMALAVVIFIGLVAGASANWRREWWTRYGSWIAIYGAGFMALALAAVFGRVWLSHLFLLTGAGWRAIQWGAVIGWVASTAAGLLAGNSDKTKGGGQGSSKVLEWVAPIGGIVFIAGAVLALSAVLQVVLVRIWLDSSGFWWSDLDSLLAAHGLGAMLVSLAILAICGAIFSWRFNLNIFGMNQFYRNRLVRCYLGATRWMPGLRRPNRFTGFDEYDDLDLAELRSDAPGYKEKFRGPFPLVNCSLNLGGSSDLSVKTRQSTSFTLTPLSAGAARQKVGFAPMNVDRSGFSGGVSVGEAASISGAAASPNMGYNTSPLVAVLLTMFNVRLAWWFPNPGKKRWNDSSFGLGVVYLIQEFLGIADETGYYVNVSDGGHFENLAIYELIRRRAKVIVASDAECDPDLAFGSLGNVIRICETDLGAKIDIDVESIRKQKNGKSRAHCVVGKIAYSNGSLGYLIYLKSSMTGDEDADIEQYRAVHPDFPHQSTSDQFFTEDQFESYRRLGYHIATLAFRGIEPGADLVGAAGKLYDLWTPSGVASDIFVKHAATLDLIWERFRASTELHPLLQELMADQPGPDLGTRPGHEHLAACLELTQLMENVFLDLRLDDFWDHPDNRGWAVLFTMWAKSPIFRSAWKSIHGTFGIRFEYFCRRRLGLE
jgi:hypothetical protein